MIENEGFNSLEYFGVMDRDMEMLVMAKLLVSRAVVTHKKLETVHIEGLQDIVWWIHYRQTHNHPLIES